MRTISLVCLCLLFGAAYGQDFRTGHEPTGFRGLKWGSAPDSGMYEVENVGDLVTYGRLGDDLTMGTATLSSIHYTYWRFQLQGVGLATDGYLDWKALKETTFAEFGRGYQSNEYIETYVWLGDSSTMHLSYKSISTKGRLFIFSRKLTTDMDNVEKEKAKTGKW